MAGAGAALKASVISGGLYYAAMKYSPFFRYSFNASARTALTCVRTIAGFTAQGLERDHSDR